MKAIISTGNKQYVVSEGDVLDIDLIETEKAPEFEALMIVDGEKISVGTPTVKGASVKAEIVEENIKGEKVVAIRFKAKKRVNKVRGHRQQYTRIKINSISL